MPLTRLLDATPGDGIVRSIAVEDRAARRLAELGIRPGTRVCFVRRTTGGGIVVDAGGSRIALDRTTAANVKVEQP